MASDEKIPLYTEITTQGCCRRCALRYLGFDRSLLTFEHPETCLVNFGILSPFEEFEFDVPNKKRKVNPCAVCLGLLQDELLEEILSHEDLLKSKEYDSDIFMAHITFPVCVLIRDHSMKLHLKKKFPQVFDESRVLKINNVWRLSVENRLSKIVGKTLDWKDSKLTLHFYTEYELEAEEMGFIKQLPQDNSTQSSLSRHYVVSMLDSVSDDEFSKLVTVPPKVPFYGVTLKCVNIYSEAIHLIGNYCKYSRECPQSSLFGTSVENVILTAVREVARNCKSVKFKSSNNENFEMRVLGNGRTFTLQLIDPKFSSFSQSQCLEIEELAKHSGILTIKNLRVADKRDILLPLDSERRYPLSYKVLCMVWTQKNIDYCINAINMYPNLTVTQKTPLKSIHQKAYKVMKKKIFYIRAKKVGDKLIEIDLCVQVGLSVQEFINGDLGRTTPSIREIIRAKTDVLAIDLVSFQATQPCAADEEDVVI